VRSTSTSAPTNSSDLRLVLASKSPQREAILRQLGVPFRVRVSDYVEAAGIDDPASLVVAHARGKAHDVLKHVRHTPGVVVLGVDTVVALDGAIFGKASDDIKAREFLRALSGRTHTVYSGICLADAHREETGCAMTKVTFRDLDSGTLARYVASGEWRERAGAYAIQGIGSALVTAVEGDYWNVVGLPVDLLVGALGRFGAAPLSWL
jgi:septum formation protein